MNIKPRSVLIVDDDKIIRDSLKCYFEDEGWYAVSAVSGEDAIDELKDKSLDCAIVDIKLPGMNGHEFINKMDHDYPDMACVICTGSFNYIPPADVIGSSRVSDTVFTKPVRDMKHVETELIRLIEKR